MSKFVITLEDSGAGVMITSEPSLSDLADQVRRGARSPESLSTCEILAVAAWEGLRGYAQELAARGEGGSYSEGNLH